MLGIGENNSFRIAYIGKVALILIVFLFLSINVSATWWNSSYQYRRQINCSNIDDGIPIVINGSDGFDLGCGKQIVWAYCSGTGTALYYNNCSDYVVANDTTQLPMEVEQGNGTSYLPSQVWSDYAGVWHFANLLESANGNNATTVGDPAQNETKIDGGYSLDGDDAFDVAHSPSIDIGDSDLSIMFWTKTSIGSGDCTIWLNKQADTEYVSFESYCGLADKPFRWLIKNPSGTACVVYTDDTWADGNWHFITVTYDISDCSNTKIYIDGSLASIGVQEDNDNIDGSNSADMSLFYKSTTNSNFLVGDVDETRIIESYLSASYINQTYQNMIGTLGFGNILAEEQQVTYPAITLNSPQDNAITNDNTPDFNFTVTGNETSYSCELFINDTGYGVANTEDDTEDAYGCEGSFDASYPCSNAVDEDWATKAGALDGNDAIVYENYTIPDTFNSVNWTFKYANAPKAGTTTTGFYCWNYTGSVWNEIYLETGTVSDTSPATLTKTIPSDCLQNVLRLKVELTTGNTTDYSYYYEGKVTWIGTTLNNTPTVITANTSLSDGTYNWYINCSTTSTTIQSETRTITIDTTPPSIQFVHPTTAAGTYSQNYIEANVSATDSNLDKIVIYLYNSTGLVQSNVSSTSPFFVNFTNLADGTYYLNATANDTAGNLNKTATREITLAIPPSIQFVSPTPANGTTIYEDYVEINISIIDENLDVVIFNWNGTNTTYTTSQLNGSAPNYWLLINKTNLTKGDYTYYAWANDTAGNTNQTETRYLFVRRKYTSNIEQTVQVYASIERELSANRILTQPISIDDVIDSVLIPVLTIKQWVEIPWSNNTNLNMTLNVWIFNNRGVDVVSDILVDVDENFTDFTISGLSSGSEYLHTETKYYTRPPSSDASFNFTPATLSGGAYGTSNEIKMILPVDPVTKGPIATLVEIYQSILTQDYLKTFLSAIRMNYEVLQLNDIARAMASYVFEVYQSIQIVDMIEKFKSALVEVTQQLQLSDVVQRIFLTFRKPEQQLQLQDFTTRILSSERTFQEILNIYDSLTKILTYERTTQEQAQLQDLASRIFSGVRKPEQQLQLQDTFTLFFSGTISIQQQLQLQDFTTRILSSERTFQEILNIYDSLTKILTYERTTQEQLQLQDLVSRIFSGIRTPEQQLQLQDFTTRILSSERTFQEILNIYDSLTKVAAYGRVTQEQAQLQDLVSRIFSGIRKPEQQITISDIIETLLTKKAIQIQETISLDIQIKRIFSGIRTASQQIFLYISAEKQSLPVIHSVELQVLNLGNSRDLILRINVTDPDDNLDYVKFGDYEVFSPPAGGLVSLNISDELSQAGDVYVYDQAGYSDFYEINFSLTDNGYQQIYPIEDLDQQVIEVNDTLRNLHSTLPLKYNITHYQLGTTLTGGNFYGTLSASSNVSLYTKLQGDFLTNYTYAWQQFLNETSWVYNQSLERPLNITSNISGITWNVSVGNATLPRGYTENCTYCSNHTVSFTDTYYNEREWYHYGDAIEDKFYQDIEDVVIGERTEYWWEYYYRNLTDVELINISANISINDSLINWGDFIRIFNDTAWVNLTEPNITIKSSDCNSTTPSLYCHNISKQGISYRFCGCSMDKDNDGRVDYFRVIIPEFSKWNVRVGGYTTPAPVKLVRPYLGLECSKDRWGDTYETTNGTLLCCRGEWRWEDECERKQIEGLPIISAWLPYMFIALFVICLLIFVLSERERILGLFEVE